MAKEHERKFLCKYIPENLPKMYIEQGYIFYEEKKHLRVRICEELEWDESGGVKVWDVYCSIGLKFDEEERDEFEYTVPFSDATQIMKKCEIKLDKTRYTTKHENCTVHIDDFGDIKIIEIETPTKHHSFTIPDYFGEEVTGDKKYSNIAIAKAQSIKV